MTRFSARVFDYEDDDDDDWADPDEDETAWETAVWDRLRGRPSRAPADEEEPRRV